MPRQLRVLLGLSLAVALPIVCQAQVLPRPTYDNSVHIGYICWDDCLSTDAIVSAKAADLQQRIGSGPYSTLGLEELIAIDMPWNANLSSPVLSSPLDGDLRAVLDRLKTNGLTLHLSVLAGVTRENSIYAPAVAEDRRNAQWYLDGATDRVTPSRYARKLRRHLEAKTRAFAGMLATLMHDYPDTLVRAAGDGEIELTDTRLDQNTPYESQIIADYSPFTILEFRDWVRHTGLYGPGAQYDGQGRVASGTRYQDDVAGLANFNADFGTSFATWDLCYFNWSLADPIDGDPNAIPASQYTQSTWSPLPTDGPAYIANGFDAPRAWNLPTAQFWQLWLEFREQMISNYVKDFTTWMMTTTTTDDLTVSPSRWYTYQIPADYIYGTYPGCANPDRRLLVGASTMQSANVGSAAGVGLTVFDQYFWNGSTNYYERTSQYLFPAMASAGFPNWGMIEFNLASPINAVETDPAVIANQIYNGYAAGCHVYAYCPTSQDPDDINWPANIEGLKMFVGRVAFQPRDSATHAYVPPQVSGVNGYVTASGLNLMWSPRIFPELAQPLWSQWPDFLRFEVWHGPTSDFSRATGTLLKTTTATGVSGLALSAGQTYYKIAAVSGRLQYGDLSPALQVVVPQPTIGIPTITAPTPNQVLANGGVSFTWTSIGGVSGYDLRTFDGPTGATIFSGSLDGGGSTSALLSLPDGAYTFAVRACSGAPSDATCGAFGSVSFSISSPAPSGVPTVTFPTQGATLSTSTQTLTWTSVAKVDPASPMQYQLVLTDITTGLAELQISVLDATSTIFSLRSSSHYQLKVRACQAGCGAWSVPVDFAVTLPPIPTSVPVITNATVSGGNSLSVWWTGVANADLYQIQVVQPTSGPGGGALTVAAMQVSATTVTLPIPQGDATIFVWGCTGDGCGPQSAGWDITAPGPNPSTPNLGTPLAGSSVTGPTVNFSWNRIPGDTGSNTEYRLYVGDNARSRPALDVYTTANYYAANFKAEGTRYDALVIANPRTASPVQGPATGFLVRGPSGLSPTMVQPAYGFAVPHGNVQVEWTPIPGASVYEYYLSQRVTPPATPVTFQGVTPGLSVQVPLKAIGGVNTNYLGIVRACPQGATCTAASDAGWGIWSNQPGGGGLVEFTVTP